MRTIIWAVIFFTGIPVAAIAQLQKTSVQIPRNVKRSFQQNYPGVKAGWEREGAGYEASFIADGKRTSVVYNKDGRPEATEVQIPVTGLPKPVTQYITAKRLGRIQEANKITKADGGICYEAVIKGQDYLFDRKGAFLGIEKD